ncbi:MAG: class I SAM-dependent methyltransferase [Chlamydiales bacterium]|nr:class I SAM-dependent methyltransferase [Chlamydiia bacterium]MCP5503660.1 class I SAM-dependent methyltransferase [Chlamydiales bacterium]
MYNDLDRLLIRKHRGCYLKYLSLIHQIEVKSIVEIGVFRGKNAAVLRQEFPDAHLYLIDPWTPSTPYLESGSAVSEKQMTYDQAFDRVKALFEEDPKVTLIKKIAANATSEVPNNLDLVFIDANHEYHQVKEDILTWKEKVRPGGIISGHNYGRNRLPGVKKAVDEIFGENFFLGQDEVWLHII